MVTIDPTIEEATTAGGTEETKITKDMGREVDREAEEATPTTTVTQREEEVVGTITETTTTIIDYL